MPVKGFLQRLLFVGCPAANGCLAIVHQYVLQVANGQTYTPSALSSTERYSRAARLAFALGGLTGIITTVAAYWHGNHLLLA